MSLENCKLDSGLNFRDKDLYRVYFHARRLCRRMEKGLYSPKSIFDTWKGKTKLSPTLVSQVSFLLKIRFDKDVNTELTCSQAVEKEPFKVSKVVRKIIRSPLKIFELPWALIVVIAHVITKVTGKCRYYKWPGRCTCYTHCKEKDVTRCLGFVDRKTGKAYDLFDLPDDYDDARDENGALAKKPTVI